jgi:hypothetical protein
LGVVQGDVGWAGVHTYGVKGRLWMVLAMLSLLAGTVLAILGAMFLGWRFGMDRADLPTRVNTVVAVCAFVLVGATLIVALIAYIAATGQPDLHPELRFRMSFPNQPVLEVYRPGEGRVRQFRPWRQTECQAIVRNKSRFAARNPGVRIELEGLGGLKEQDGWTILAWANMIGPTAIQWDGGADYLIHGRWSRTLPMLNFQDVFVQDHVESPALIVIVAADGLAPKRLRVPVRVLESDDYHEHTRQQAEKLFDPKTGMLRSQQETSAVALRNTWARLRKRPTA